MFQNVISCFLLSRLNCFKDTRKEKAPSNENSALMKSINMAIWVAGTLKSTIYLRFLYQNLFFKKIKY